METTILKLKTILSAQDFILTGSYVLSKVGLVDKSKVMDLDIILVKPEIATIETINRLMAEFPSKTKPKAIKVPKEEDGKKRATRPTPDVSAIFMFHKIKIDIFVMDSCGYNTINVDGIKCTTVDSIIKAKQSYGRMKDWLQLRDMSRLFFRQEQFESILNGNWRGTLKQEY